MARIGGAVVLGVHLLLALTVWQLWWFQLAVSPAASASSGERDSIAVWLPVDLLLALQFAVPHSVLLRPAVRGWLTRKIVPSAWYGLFFCTATCLSLLLTFGAWRTCPVVIWQATGFSRFAIVAGFGFSWAFMLYSLNLTGLGWQTGLTPWLAAARGQAPPRREFRPTGVYRAIRHPVYLAVLGVLWFTPTLTLDRLVLVAVWSGYIVVGSRLKDARLAAAIGGPYRRYLAETPGYVPRPTAWGRPSRESLPADPA